MITVYFDRRLNSIEGVLTVQRLNPDEKIETVFNRLPARSGQKGYTHTNWVRGKSPVPFGKHRLWLQPVSPGTWAGQTGIGEFYPISTREDKRAIVNTGDPSLRRLDIGLHPENALPGSAGCIVLLADTPERKAEVSRLFAFLRESADRYAYLPLVVL